MALADFSGAPQLDIVTNPRERRNLGIGGYYVDTYNDAQMAKFNNEYNYWLWQQQADYNTPAAQMQRAKDAGLNPNVVAGNVSSGNLSNLPESNGKLSGNIFSNQMQMANLALNSFNSLIKAVGEGIQATSSISGIPDDIQGYRHALTEIQQSNATSAAEKAQIATADRMLKYLGVSKGFYEIGKDSTEFTGGDFKIAPTSPYAMDTNLKLALMRGLDSLRGQQIKESESRIDVNDIRKGLMSSQDEYTQTMKELQTINTGNKVFDTILKIFTPILFKAIR